MSMRIHGRRLASRTRVRTGEMTDADGTLEDVVNPPETGTSPEDTTDDTSDGTGINIGIWLGL